MPIAQVRQLNRMQFCACYESANQWLERRILLFARAADMNTLAQTIYSVHLEGLSQAERSAFSGLVRLAERSGMLFRVETVMAQSDIVILDGADHRIVELGQADNNIAPRTIWIDPPSNLHTPRQLKRPLNWPELLVVRSVNTVTH